MARKTSPTTKLVAGVLLLLFQATANRGSVVACYTAECFGRNLVGVGLWVLGAWLVYSALRAWRSPS